MVKPNHRTFDGAMELLERLLVRARQQESCHSRASCEHATSEALEAIIPALPRNAPPSTTFTTAAPASMALAEFRYEGTYRRLAGGAQHKPLHPSAAPATAAPERCRQGAWVVQNTKKCGAHGAARAADATVAAPAAHRPRCCRCEAPPPI